ncbi:MAG: AmmeMemoRadiSam system radical SAM enzyme [Clostridiales bacterium]|nr:AmmeMemoRadiSam system radical SAM enzyme [Clostridiales bacterium]
MKEAMYYTRDGDTVRCFLCPHACVLKPEQTGRCSVRRNKGGVLYSLNYGEITACNVDPIEKKPLYHFYPGRPILSVGSFGCNLKCGFCQNHAIAHGTPGTVFVSPGDLVSRAMSVRDNIGIAYTYNEPSIWYEYVLDTARLARERVLKNVLVTNGYIGIKALEQLLPFIDALNIDIKAFSDDYYGSICSGRLSPVLDTVKAAAGCCHVEVTTLVVDELNSDTGQLESLAEWIAGVDKHIPIHLSRYYPAYQMDRPPTRLDTMAAAKEAVKKHLEYVYIGNVAGVDNNTYCPACDAKLVERRGHAARLLFDGKKCGDCGKPISMVV